MFSERRWIFCLAASLFVSCGKRPTVLHPSFEGGGLLEGSVPLAQESLEALAGMYTIEGEGALRGSVLLHPAKGTLSIFAVPDAAYAIMKGGCIEGGARVIFEGYWRYPSREDTGLVRLSIDDPKATEVLCSETPLVENLPPVTFIGATGEGVEPPANAMTLSFDRALVDPEDHFVVVAHHGACRTIDDCGASENSLRSIKMVESFGAKVVELDARVTADGVPILYHDDTFDSRLSNGLYCHGPVEEFTLAHIRSVCKLKFGEQVPTLEEALDTALHKTRLEGVWIDIKVPAAVKPSLELELRYNELAAKMPGRKFKVALGLPDEEILGTWLAASPPPGTPCLVELEPADVRSSGCHFWGPRWTLGPMAEEVASLQKDGHAVVFWTIDELEFINLFLKTAKPNGIVSDRAGLVLHRFHSFGIMPEGSVNP